MLRRMYNGVTVYIYVDGLFIQLNPSNNNNTYAETTNNTKRINASTSNDTIWNSYFDNIKEVFKLSNIANKPYIQQDNSIFTSYPNDPFNSITCNEAIEAWLHLLPSPYMFKARYKYEYVLDFVRSVFFPYKKSESQVIGSNLDMRFKYNYKWIMDSSFLSFSLKFKQIEEVMEWTNDFNYEKYTMKYEIKWSVSTIIDLSSIATIQNGNANTRLNKIINSILFLDTLKKAYISDNSSGDFDIKNKLPAKKSDKSLNYTLLKYSTLNKLFEKLEKKLQALGAKVERV